MKQERNLSGRPAAGFESLDVWRPGKVVETRVRTRVTDAENRVEDEVLQQRGIDDGVLVGGVHIHADEVPTAVGEHRELTSAGLGRPFDRANPRPLPERSQQLVV